MMLAASRDPRFAAARQRTSSFNMPAPVGGLNARDAYTDMSKQDAITLTNLFPEASYLAVRKGTTVARVMPISPRTLLTYNGGSGTDQLFAATVGPSYNIYNALNSAGPVVSGLGSGDFQWTNITTSGGTYLIAVNGVDAMYSYNGSVWANPAITGPSSATFINVCQFKERLWFATVNSLDLYYLGLQAIAGAATVFPMGSVFRRGGYVIGLGTFSNDAGDGPDDYFAIITSNGEIAIYQGTDPDNANTWSLVGRFDIGKPIGRRCTVRLSGDLAVITQDGIFSLQAALRFDRSNIQKAAITGKIQTLFSQYSGLYFGNFGWQPCVYPKARYLVVNVPTVTNTTAVQLVMNTITGAWCQFDFNAICWGIANDNLYFGHPTRIYKADTGYTDALPNGNSDPTPINWEVQTSWQMVGGAKNKFFTMVKPTLLAGAGTAYNMAIDVDFRVSTLSAATASQGSGMIWGVWKWPGTWAGTTPSLDSRWHSTGAIGTWSSVHMKGLTNGAAAQVTSYEIIAEPGGPL